jgi:hypothetical protein
MAKYKVLTVRQPYASLLVSGIKDVENRSRRTNYRGTVLIHAGAKWHEIMEQLPTKIWLLGASPVEQQIVKMAAEVTRNDLFGCIVGSVEIVDCVQDSTSEWAERGQWHWICRNAKVFAQPIRNVKGRLGLWDWEGIIND